MVRDERLRKAIISYERGAICPTALFEQVAEALATPDGLSELDSTQLVRIWEVIHDRPEAWDIAKRTYPLLRDFLPS
jgi:hypothetical protein